MSNEEFLTEFRLIFSVALDYSRGDWSRWDLQGAFWSWDLFLQQV